MAGGSNVWNLFGLQTRGPYAGCVGCFRDSGGASVHADRLVSSLARPRLNYAFAKLSAIATALRMAMDLLTVS